MCKIIQGGGIARREKSMEKKKLTVTSLLSAWKSWKRKMSNEHARVESYMCNAPQLFVNLPYGFRIKTHRKRYRTDVITRATIVYTDEYNEL